MKWLEIDQDNLHTKFSALNVDFSSPSPDPLGSRRPAQAGVKDSYPTKKFSNIWMLCTFQYWTVTKWLELDQDNLSMKFSALNVDFSSLSPDPLGSWSPAQAGIKDGYPS